MTALKATTTIFFYRTGDEPRKADWQKALSAVWKVTPLEMQPYSAYASYAAEMEKPSGHSFLTIDNSLDEFGITTTFLQLRLPWTEKQNINGKRTMWKELVRIPLDNSMETLAMKGGIEDDYLYGAAVIGIGSRTSANLLRPVSKLLAEERRCIG
ncbi:MAG: hypothetical protein IPG74_15110 [Flavobacteriales bacterium]|nr:hypothetical protein [Flavobacteriales bacterium]